MNKKLYTLIALTCSGYTFAQDNALEHLASALHKLSMQAKINSQASAQDIADAFLDILDKNDESSTITALQTIQELTKEKRDESYEAMRNQLDDNAIKVLTPGILKHLLTLQDTVLKKFSTQEQLNKTIALSSYDTLKTALYHILRTQKPEIITMICDNIKNYRGYDDPYKNLLGSNMPFALSFVITDPTKKPFPLHPIDLAIDQDNVELFKLLTSCFNLSKEFLEKKTSHGYSKLGCAVVMSKPKIIQHLLNNEKVSPKGILQTALLKANSAEIRRAMIELLSTLRPDEIKKQLSEKSEATPEKTVWQTLKDSSDESMKKIAGYLKKVYNLP